MSDRFSTAYLKAGPPRVWVAVGIPVARYPPHRSPRAELPHGALIVDEWRQSGLRAKDEERAVRESIEPVVDAFAPSSGSAAGPDGLKRYMSTCLRHLEA